MSTIARGRHVRDPRHPVASLLVRGALTAVAVVVVVSLSAAAVLVRQLDGNIVAADVEALLEDRPTPEPEATEALNILVLGADRAEGEAVDLGSSVEQSRRADTTILVHLAADRDSATLVSIPRDSMVQGPACLLEDGTRTDAGLIQFNAAFEHGGVACTINTVEETTGVFIDHYVVVDYDGFLDIVDALGGVRVCLPEAVDDSFSGLDLPAGEQTVRGDQALAYVRARKIGDGSDLGRIERQQAFIASMVQQATSTGLLARPNRLISVLDAGTRSLTTDPGLASVTALASVARSVQALPADRVRFVTVPTEPWPQDENRVVWTPAADELWASIREDAPLPGSEPSAPPSPEPSPTQAPDPLTVSPAEITVDVVNAGARGGAAGDAATDLRIQGFTVGAILNGDEEVDGVRLVVPPGQEEAARTVLEAFPDAELVAATDGERIRVELGSGAPFVQEVPNRLGDEPLPQRTLPPDPGASPSLSVRAATDDICA
ncbi:LCP family protein [Aquipuribacter nitratireducens]|uniref:LCP family protein n=1 Tax=Aquipuribacter nitratireducens TaxID=650104 RepID=A0ABW0GPU2_9MICO